MRLFVAHLERNDEALHANLLLVEPKDVLGELRDHFAALFYGLDLRERAPRDDSAQFGQQACSVVAGTRQSRFGNLGIQRGGGKRGRGERSAEHVEHDGPGHG